MKKIIATICLFLLLAQTAEAATVLKRFRTTGRNSPGQHYQDNETAQLPPLEASPFPNEVWAQTIDTSTSYTAQNSRFASIRTSGSNIGGAGSYNIQAINFHFAYRFSSTKGESIFTITTPDVASVPSTRIMDFLQNSAGKIEVYDFTSTATPVLTGTHVYTANDRVYFRIQFDMGATEGTGSITIQTYDVTTRALIETITGSNIDFGDPVTVYASGDSKIGRGYYGRTVSRGGNVIGTYGEGYAITGGFLPFGAFVNWQYPTRMISAANGWAVNGTTDYVDAVKSFDSTSADLGKYISHATSTGTGSGTRINYGFSQSTGLKPSNQNTIYGVTVCMDGWSTTTNLNDYPNENLYYRYNGVDYSIANITMPILVAGDGGNPHTRCIQYFDESGGTYLGPDGLPWTQRKIQDSSIGVEVADDANGRIYITDVMMGVMYARK